MLSRTDRHIRESRVSRAPRSALPEPLMPRRPLSQSTLLGGNVIRLT